MVELTVIFATKNGAHVLPRTLNGYQALGQQDFCWKLVVVDNGSTDATSEILQSYKDELPITILEQPAPGKNKALNTALPAVEGDLVIFTDDDAIPERGFLRHWRDTLRDKEDYDVFGGTILPLFEAPPPEWMLRSEAKFAELFAVQKLKTGPVDAVDIFGPNMAVRRRVLDDGMRFQDSIGPNSQDKHYPMGSETDFCVRASKAGYRTWFTSAPTVHHIIRKSQLEPASWAARAYRLGRGTARLHWELGMFRPAARRSLLFATLSRAWNFLRRSLLFMKTARLEPSKRFHAVWEYKWRCGYQDELLKMRSISTIKRADQHFAKQDAAGRDTLKKSPT